VIKRGRNAIQVKRISVLNFGNGTLNVKKYLSTVYTIFNYWRTMCAYVEVREMEFERMNFIRVPSKLLGLPQFTA